MLSDGGEGQDVSAGADTPPAAHVTADSSGAAAPWWHPHVSLDRTLRREGLRDLTVARAVNAGGFVRVTGEFENISDRKLSVMYRFTWLDASGQPVDSILGDWQVVHALPGARARIAGTAPRDDVGDFRLELEAASRMLGSGDDPPDQRHTR